ncbi:MAG: glycosyltransferase [Nanoarchaeota archaeon]
MDLQSKNVLLVGWGCENEKDTFMYQIYYLMFKRIFPKLLTFDSKKKYFQSGKDAMNKQLLDYVKDKELDLIIFAMDEEEFYPETILKITELHPNTRSLFIISDDDTRFDHYSRYFALLFDHTITSSGDFTPDYKKDGIKKVDYHIAYNTHKLEPLNVKKEYDVTFIGRPKANRQKIIKYLLDNGIKIKLFGWDWYQYPEFKEIYQGPLSQEEYVKIINQTKINLTLTRSGYSEQKQIFNLKFSIFEKALCKSFQLVESNPKIINLFKPTKEIILFNSKEELLKKIKYYLKHKELREKIAKRTYEKVITKYNSEKDMRKIILKILDRTKEKITSPKIKKNLMLIKKEDLRDIQALNFKLKNTDYVYFSENPQDSIYKNNFQAYSLDKTHKEISCCDYYVYSRSLGDYLRLRTNFAFKRIGKEANKLINIAQLMIKKDYFLKNIGLIKKLFNNKDVELIDEKNTAFVSMPLTRINNVKIISYEDMTKSFDMKFITTLFSLGYQKRLFKTSYVYKLFLKSLSYPFIIKYIIKSIFNKHNWDKLNLNKSYVKNSPLKKLTKNV